jgi:hypothetical protein
MNLIEEAKNQIGEIVTKAYEKAAEKGTLPAGQTMGGTIEIPKDLTHGDYACGWANVLRPHNADGAPQNCRRYRRRN